ncbi:MAG: hypothetical protein LBP22_07770 [Deltaproteobacteria bacterium]|nr:hypothetical protein [Deltaproteobacteria bacterium]
MKYFSGLFAAVIAAFLVMTAPASAQPFEDLDFDRQNPGQSAQVPPAPTGPSPSVSADDPDRLLLNMFSGDETAPAQAGPPTAGAQSPNSGSLQNLPGEPSPTRVPAGPGEAKIEKDQPQAQSQTRVRRSSAPKRIYEPFQQRWVEAEKAWARDISNIPVNCVSLVSDRTLYHINCAGYLR